MIEKVNQKEKEEDPFYFKVLAWAYVKRGAANCFLSKFEQAISDLDKAL